MFMVDLVSSSDSLGVAVVSIPENLKTLVDKNIVYRKIGDSVCQYAQAYWKANPNVLISP